ncbi:Phosphate transport system permease protein PstA [Acididesulfobacillus acetoxydans]|uniref:Phosphate transport system permease protein PstA n=1 Tax=Acididesulfobacillus acetoxydans TaxID=1561005 RepID=A0A8S0W8E7_9FIRM|nr:phosphate ABC transporter permease PstA [Acididesulfobacillus acetoxydans]CAA7601789.1 Phosphate transport system permease protein PstA [Acididesulfobacillus acetoxydans]CEJ09209.1 Phosphate ABC transporter, inner membrane subunit PstA [Acididesulfobacillus acetoxydans]
MKAKQTNALATLLLWLAALAIVGILAWFLIFILGRGLPVLGPQFFTGPNGVGGQFFNSFYILFLSLVFSLPVGVGAGIYLAEYAPKNRLTDVMRLSTESLATVPSIVLGLFGMIIFVNVFKLGFTILGGAATLALLNLPVLVRVTEESLRNVPASYREASLALGATMWQTLRKVILPTALPGLVTGTTLVAGRALGETAILIFTAGMSVSRHLFDLRLTAPGETLAVHLYAVQANPLPGTHAGRVANGTAALLVLVALAFNLLLALPSRWLQHRLSGKRG